MMKETFCTALSSDNEWIVIVKHDDGMYILPTHPPYAIMQMTGNESHVKEIADLQRLNCYKLYGDGKTAVAIREFKEAIGECFRPMLDWLSKKLSK